MIALVRMELWLTFWVALLLALAFGVPVLELNEGGVLSLLQDPKAARALARLATALPFGLAVYQFGVQKLRGTTGVLLHRGVPRARIFVGKALLATLFFTLVSWGIVELEYRMTVDNQGDRTLFRNARWIVPQLVALGTLAWGTGALVTIGARESLTSIALRAGVGFVAVLGAHHWIGLGAAELPVPTGWGVYILGMLTAAWLTGRVALARYGRGSRPHPDSEPRVALRAALLAALLFPWLDGLRSQTVALAERAMAPELPKLWRHAEQGEVVRSEPVDRASERLVTLDGEVLIPTYRGRPAGYELLGVSWTNAELARATAHFEFPPLDRVALDIVAAERGGHVEVELSARTGIVRLVTVRRSPSGEAEISECIARRSDGLSLSASARFIDVLGASLVWDPGDQTLWSLDAARGEQALQSVELPPGGAIAHFDNAVVASSWILAGQRRVAGIVPVTVTGRYVYRDALWQPFDASLFEGKFLLESELDSSAVLPHLVATFDPLGRHQGVLRSTSDATTHTFDLASTRSRARSARNVVVATGLLRPVAQRLVESLGTPSERARLAALPAWLHAGHIVIGLALAAWCWRRGRSARGRCWFALTGFAGGPLALGVLHVLLAELDDEEAAGPAGASPEAVFLDAEARVRRAA